MVRSEDVREDYHEIVSCLSWCREPPTYQELETNMGEMLKMQWRRDLAETRKMARGARYK